MLSDLSQYVGSDLSSSNSGDVQTVTGVERGKQRILRRLITNPGDYIWDLTYGAGLPQWIGMPVDVPKITATIQTSLTLEDVVAKTPIPQIAIAQLPSDLTEFTVTIDYVDAPSNTPVTLSFTVAP